MEVDSPSMVPSLQGSLEQPPCRGNVCPILREQQTLLLTFNPQDPKYLYEPWFKLFKGGM